MALFRPVMRSGRSIHFCVPRGLRFCQLRGLATAADTPQHSSTDHVRLVEVGPRDGLQNEKNSIPVRTKIDLIERLARTGLTDIEAGSFVAAKWVPQVSQYKNPLCFELSM